MSEFSECAGRISINIEGTARESARINILSGSGIANHRNKGIFMHDFLGAFVSVAPILRLDCSSMQVISFKNTGLFKRGIWLTAAALLVCVAAPPALDGTLWQNPLPSAIAVAILASFSLFFLVKMQIHRLADEVVDCADFLKIRRGRTELDVPLASISGVEVSTFSGIHRISVQLLKPTKLGARIEFLPQASLWSDLAAVKRVAAGLAGRANLMRGAAI